MFWRQPRNIYINKHVSSIYWVLTAKATKMRKADFLPLRGLTWGPEREENQTIKQKTYWW